MSHFVVLNVLIKNENPNICDIGGQRVNIDLKYLLKLTTIGNCFTSGERIELKTRTSDCRGWFVLSRNHVVILYPDRGRTRAEEDYLLKKQRQLAKCPASVYPSSIIPTQSQLTIKNLRAGRKQGHVFIYLELVQSHHYLTSLSQFGGSQVLSLKQGRIIFGVIKKISAEIAALI